MIEIGIGLVFVSLFIPDPVVFLFVYTLGMGFVVFGIVKKYW